MKDQREREGGGKERERERDFKRIFDAMVQITHSSGNHGQAVAWASKCVDIPSYIVVPATAPASKKSAILGYGAQLFECGSKPTDRYSE